MACGIPQLHQAEKPLKTAHQGQPQDWVCLQKGSCCGSAEWLLHGAKGSSWVLGEEKAFSYGRKFGIAVGPSDNTTGFSPVIHEDKEKQNSPKM